MSKKNNNTKFCLFVTVQGEGTKALRYGSGSSAGPLAGKVRLFTTRTTAASHAVKIKQPDALVCAVRENDTWARR